MNPILVIGLVFLVLLACGVAFDLRQRRLGTARRNLGLEARNARGAAESHGGVGGADVQGRYGGPGL